MSLSDAARRRYAQQIILPEIGEAGQKQLAAAKILVVGAGGLGSPVLLYLAAAGVGTLGVADHDQVELSNLNRQIIHETGDIGRPKTDSARDAIYEINPEYNINIIKQKINKENAQEYITPYDLVVDGSDNSSTRYAVHDACYAAQIPLVSAAVSGFTGQISTFKAYLGPPHPCYRCLYPDVPQQAGQDCVNRGILGPVAGVMGAWQAAEVIKELLSLGISMSGYLSVFDGLNGKIKKVVLPRDPACSLCHHEEKKHVRIAS